MILLSHPTGNAFVRATARALHQNGMLHAFYTTVAASEPPLAGWLPAPVRREALRRRFSEVPRSLVRTHPWREGVRLAATAVGAGSLTRPGRWASVDAVYHSLDRFVAGRVAVAPDALKGVYAYEDGADDTFRAARARGMACVYELPIAHWQTTQRLLREEAERRPAWRITMHGIDDPPEKLARKSREIEAADVVVVPSRFVLESLPGSVRSSKPCVVAPFGSPTGPRETARAVETGGKLRVLFAGSLSQRKGLADVFEAFRLLNRSDVELVVMGSLVAPMSFYRGEYAAFVYEPPRPHPEVLALMQTCDVLVLPAIVEGRALVQQEALACGLPLIVTASAGADDLIVEGQTGVHVPTRSPEVIADRIARLADDRPRLEAMRPHARRRAAEVTWTRYEAHVLSAVGLAVGGQTPIPEPVTA